MPCHFTNLAIVQNSIYYLDVSTNESCTLVHLKSVFTFYDSNTVYIETAHLPASVQNQLKYLQNKSIMHR